MMEVAQMAALDIIAHEVASRMLCKYPNLEYDEEPTEDTCLDLAPMARHMDVCEIYPLVLPAWLYPAGVA